MERRCLGSEADEAFLARYALTIVFTVFRYHVDFVTCMRAVNATKVITTLTNSLIGVKVAKMAMLKYMPHKIPAGRS